MTSGLAVPVPPFQTVFTEPEIDEALRGIGDVLRTGRLVLGPYTEAFEAAFGQLVGSRRAVAVNSGSTALEVILRALQLDGAAVLVPSNTNFATAKAVLAAGARPVFYDCGLCVDRDEVLRRVGPDTRAVMVVHIGGHISADLPALAGRLAELGVPLVEDAAHAHGSTLGGRPAGTFGHAAFSFFPTKVITTFEGGMAVTGEPALADAFRSLRDQGKDGGGELHVLPGNSWRMTEAGAVLGLVQLGRFAAALRRRNDILDRYRSDLGDILRFPAVPAGDVVSGHKAIAFPRTGIDRAELREGARRRGVNLAREVYAVPLHRQPVFADLVEKPSDFPVTDQFCREHVCLPLWTAMSDEQVDQVVEAVRRAAT